MVSDPCGIASGAKDQRLKIGFLLGPANKRLSLVGWTSPLVYFAVHARLLGVRSGHWPSSALQHLDSPGARIHILDCGLDAWIDISGQHSCAVARQRDQYGGSSMTALLMEMFGMGLVVKSPNETWIHFPLEACCGPRYT